MGDAVTAVVGAGTSTEGPATPAGGGLSGGSVPGDGGATESSAEKVRLSGAERRKRLRQRRLLELPQSQRQSEGPGMVAAPTPPGSKRQRSSGDTPPSQRQVQKRVNNLADGSASDGSTVVVAVTTRLHPELSLDEEQARAIDQAVVTRVINQDPGFVPHFDGSRLVDGALHVTCRGQMDRQWLTDNVGHLKP